MPAIETGIIVGYLVSWAVQKARRAGRRLDETANLAIDATAERLNEFVRDKLRGHSALREVDEQASALAASSENLPDALLETDPYAWAELISEPVRDRLRLALDAVLLKNQDFSGEVAVFMSAKVSGAGRVYQAGRDQNISG